MFVAAVVGVKCSLRRCCSSSVFGLGFLNSTCNRTVGFVGLCDPDGLQLRHGDLQFCGPFANDLQESVCSSNSSGGVEASYREVDVVGEDDWYGDVSRVLSTAFIFTLDD